MTDDSLPGSSTTSGGFHKLDENANPGIFIFIA